MTKHVVVSIFDRAAQTFGPPMLVPQTNVALRSFAQEVNRQDDKNPLYTSASDFELHQVGLFDDENAQFLTSPEFRRVIAVGTDVKRTVN